MKHFNRKSTPKVKNGKVLKKNNHELTPNYYNTYQKEIQIDVEKSGKGYKHFLKKRDVIRFLDLIPNFHIYSEKLDAIVLVNGDCDYDGMYNNDGVIYISAWDKNQDILVSDNYFYEHKELFRRLGVNYIQQKNGYWCEFDIEQIKAYQLLHILLHELGHHYDRIKTKSQFIAPNGEVFAENFAFEIETYMWNAYEDEFGIIFSKI